MTILNRNFQSPWGDLLVVGPFLCPGDLIEFKRDVYSHWGVYIDCKCEDNKKIRLVVHVTGRDMPDSSPVSIRTSSPFTVKAEVTCDSIETVAAGKPFRINNVRDSQYTPAPCMEVVERALSKLGKPGYSILMKNCEHFATWCRYGSTHSEQSKAVKAAGITVLGALVGGPLGAVAGFVVGTVGQQLVDGFWNKAANRLGITW